MTDLVLAATGQLSTADLAAARRLLDQSFADLTDDDWSNAQGGVHALLWQGPELLGHASLVARRLLHRGRAWQTGYVEAVAVRPDVRRQGHGAALMAALEQAAAGAYELGALAATDEGALFYRARGWLPWRGPTSVLTPRGVVRTPEDDDCVHVLPLSAAADLDLDGELTCDWRPGDVW